MWRGRLFSMVDCRSFKAPLLFALEILVIPLPMGKILAPIWPTKELGTLCETIHPHLIVTPQIFVTLPGKNDSSLM